jgi:hypothetical protein
MAIVIIKFPSTILRICSALGAFGRGFVVGAFQVQS